MLGRLKNIVSHVNDSNLHRDCPVNMRGKKKWKPKLFVYVNKSIDEM